MTVTLKHIFEKSQ